MRFSCILLNRYIFEYLFILDYSIKNGIELCIGASTSLSFYVHYFGTISLTTRHPLMWSTTLLLNINYKHLGQGNITRVIICLGSWALWISTLCSLIWLLQHLYLKFVWKTNLLIYLHKSSSHCLLKNKTITTY